MVSKWAIVFLVLSRNQGPYGAQKISFSFWNTLKETLYFRIDADGSNTSFIHFPSKNKVYFFLLPLSTPPPFPLKEWLGNKNFWFFFLLSITKNKFPLKGVHTWFWRAIFLVTFLQTALISLFRFHIELNVWGSNTVLRNVGPECNISCLHN